MPFPTFVRGYFQKGKKDMKKESVQILIQLPHSLFLMSQTCWIWNFWKTAKMDIR